MNIFAISDLHLSINNPKPMNIFGPVWDNYLETIISDWKEKVSEDDIVLLAGDLSWAMKLEAAEEDLGFFNKLPGYKVICRGNHDYWWSSISKVREKLPNKMYAVQNDSIKIGNVVICGSRIWTVPEFGRVQNEQDKKIYDRELIRLKMSLDEGIKKLSPGDRLFVIVHYPPFNSSQNSSDFTKLISKYPVNGCVYGHLHGNIGRVTKKVLIDGVYYYLTSCDLVGNKLTLVE